MDNGRRTPPSGPLRPEIIDDEEIGARGRPDSADPLVRTLFGPREFSGGRVRVYGCSPGCLLLSLLISVVASILLTLLLNAIF
jgi:hypothetical protein